MTILDQDLEGTDATDQAIVATAVGNHVLDAGAARGRDYGAGEPVVPWVRVTQAFNNLTSLQVDYIASDANDGTGNPVVLSTITLLLAALTLNKLISMPALAPGTYRRFLVVKFTVAGIAPTLGKVRSGLMPHKSRPQDLVTNL